MKNVLKIAGMAIIFAILAYGYISYLNMKADKAAKQYAQGSKDSNVASTTDKEQHSSDAAKNQPMTLTSSVFKSGEMIPSKYTCDGDNINPPLEISGVPSSAKSLVLIMDDPDAPNPPFVHWVRFNIPATTTVIKEGKGDVLGEGGVNSARKTTFVGSCPPTGTHHYHFKLYALDDVIALGKAPSKADVEQIMQGHIVGETELVGLYIREKNR